MCLCVCEGVCVWVCVRVSEKRKWGINHKLTPQPPQALQYKTASSTLIQSLFCTYPSLMVFWLGFGSGVLGRVNSSLNVNRIQTAVGSAVFNRLLTSYLPLHPP